MASDGFLGFDRETLLDVTVNVVPMLILLFFVVMFLVWRFWDQSLSIWVIAHGLTLVPFVGLVIITWVSARLIQRDERGQEPGERESS